VTRARLVLVTVAALALARAARGADEETVAEKPPSPWSDSTELSLVFTEGNSNTESLGLKNTLEYTNARGRAGLKIDALRTGKSDDSFLLVEPGLTFEPGEVLVSPPTRAVRPGVEPDIERYFVEGRYEGNLARKKAMTWNVGASWDRNEDAGILNRTIVFAGLGHTWYDRKDLELRTSYGLSYTDREEELDDPQKERRFPGARLGLRFKDLWGASTTFEVDWTFNANLEDLGDYNVDLSPGLSVLMTKRLSLKVSLQWLYASEPALEEVDVIARVDVVDPDGIPGNGDEFFETVESGGSEITIGEDALRKKELDTAFRASLLITF
jgi:putative salt-induced outer membrane protein YdiY